MRIEVRVRVVVGIKVRDRVGVRCKVKVIGEG